MDHLSFGDPIHEVLASAERAERQTATDGLGERYEVGLHADCTRRARPTGGDSRLHFIEHEQRAVALRHFAHRLQVTGLWHADTDVLHRRLDDEARDVTRLQDALECIDVVVRHDDRVGNDARRNTRR